MFPTTLRAAGLLVAAIAVLAIAVPAASAAVDQGYVDQRNPDSKEAGRVAQEPPPPPAIAEKTGFDWGDAGIGAGTVLGLLLIAVSVMFGVVHRRRAKEESGGPALTT